MTTTVKLFGYSKIQAYSRRMTHVQVPVRLWWEPRHNPIPIPTRSEIGTNLLPNEVGAPRGQCAELTHTPRK